MPVQPVIPAETPCGLGRLTPRSEGKINDNNRGDAAGFAGHRNQCPGRERFIAAIFRPEAVVPAVAPFQQRRRCHWGWRTRRLIPLALFALAAIYKRATSALLILGTLAGAVQLLDAGNGLFQHDLGKFAGPLFIAVLQFLAVYLLYRSVRDHAANRARMNTRYAGSVMYRRDQPHEHGDVKWLDLAATALCNSKLQIVQFRENRFQEDDVSAPL